MIPRAGVTKLVAKISTHFVDNPVDESLLRWFFLWGRRTCSDAEKTSSAFLNRIMPLRQGIAFRRGIESAAAGLMPKMESKLTWSLRYTSIYRI